MPVRTGNLGGDPLPGKALRLPRLTAPHTALHSHCFVSTHQPLRPHPQADPSKEGQIRRPPKVKPCFFPLPVHHVGVTLTCLSHGSHVRTEWTCLWGRDPVYQKDPGATPLRFRPLGDEAAAGGLVRKNKLDFYIGSFGQFFFFTVTLNFSFT